jgi:hypothetical protein
LFATVGAQGVAKKFAKKANIVSQWLMWIVQRYGPPTPAVPDSPAMIPTPNNVIRMIAGSGFAFAPYMTVPLSILKQGSCEPFKAIVHGAALGLFALMGLYNAAAWINRRERHLAVNAVIYGLGVAWERRLVAHHLDTCRQVSRGAEAAMPLAPAVAEPDCGCDALKVA